jgi:hypothetical protein
MHICKLLKINAISCVLNITKIVPTIIIRRSDIASGVPQDDLPHVMIAPHPIKASPGSRCAWR